MPRSNRPKLEARHATFTARTAVHNITPVEVKQPRARLCSQLLPAESRGTWAAVPAPHALSLSDVRMHGNMDTTDPYTTDEANEPAQRNHPPTS